MHQHLIRIRPVILNLLFHGEKPVMDIGRISLHKLSGYPLDRFLLDFEAYCPFARIVNTERRKVAALKINILVHVSVIFVTLTSVCRSKSPQGLMFVS